MTGRLHPDDIEAIARRIVDLQREQVAPAISQLVDAAALARHLNVSRATVYEHAERLGAIRLGDGPKARLRFDLERATAAWTTVAEPAPAPAPGRRRRAAAAPRKGELLPIGRPRA